MSDGKSKYGEIRVMRHSEGVAWFMLSGGPYEIPDAARKTIAGLESEGTYQVVRLVGAPVKLTHKVTRQWVTSDADDVAELHDDSPHGDVGDVQAMP